MDFLQKWNHDRREYDTYAVPDDWRVATWCGDMDTVLNCAHCGEEHTYGEMYCSTEIHTQMGFGYAVCEKCHAEEMNRRRTDI